MDCSVGAASLYQRALQDAQQVAGTCGAASTLSARCVSSRTIAALLFPKLRLESSDSFMLLVHMVPTMSWFILLRLSYATTFKDSLLTVHLGVLALTTTQSKFSPRC